MSQTNLAKILEQQATSVVLLDQKQQIRYMNASAEFLFGRSGQALLGQDLSQLLAIDEALQSKLNVVNQYGSSYSIRQYQLNTPYHSNSQTIDLLISPVVEGNQHFILLELQLIDRLVRISKEEDVLAKQETTRKLVRGVAHEIKNPLGGIRGAAQLLAMELDQPELKEYTQVIIDETERLKNLVDSLLGSSRLLKISETNIHEVLERAYKLVSAQTQGKIKLVRDYDPSLPEIMADEEQLIQAVINIAFNAVEALTEGLTEQPKIVFRTRILRQFTIGSEYHKLVCHITIADNGPGIPEELLDNIFYPMISGRPTGTGLGLSISQQIATRHNGIIQCVSEPGNTEFSIYIPLMDASSNTN